MLIPSLKVSILVCLAIALVGFLVTLFVTPLVKKIAVSLDAIDKPATRKVHVGLIPRMGGLAIFFGALVSIVGFYFYDSKLFLTLFSDGYAYILLGSVLMLALGVIDDKFGLSASVKFPVQFSVAVLIVASGLRIEHITNPFGEAFHLGYLSYPITILWIVGVTNAINLSDGLDGLASGISLIVFITLFAVSMVTGMSTMLVVSAGLSGALIGFLRYNFNPAQIFMGDTGSLFLGFLLATLSIKTALVSATTVSLLIPLIALGLPIFDTLFSMVRRIITGMSPFSADKEHIHHKLLSFGLNQKQTVMILYSICIGFGAISFLLTAAKNETAAGLLFVFAIIVYVGIKRLGYLETIFEKMQEQRTVNKKKRYNDMYVKQVKRTPIIAKLTSKKRLLEIILDFGFITMALAFTNKILFDKGLFTLDILSSKCIIIYGGSYLAFIIFGYYREMWRYINLDSIGKYIKGVTGAALSSYFLIAFLIDSNSIHVNFFIVFWLFLLLLVAGSRLIFNFFATYQKRELKKNISGNNTLIYGAGDRGETVLSTIIKDDSLHYKPLGFIDDNPDKMKREILGYSVLGNIDSLEEIVIFNEVNRIIVSSPYINGHREGPLKDICLKHNVKLCYFKIQFDDVNLAK